MLTSSGAYNANQNNAPIQSQHFKSFHPIFFNLHQVPYDMQEQTTGKKQRLPGRHDQHQTQRMNGASPVKPGTVPEARFRGPTKCPLVSNADNQISNVLTHLMIRGKKYTEGHHQTETRRMGRNIVALLVAY